MGQSSNSISTPIPPVAADVDRCRHLGNLSGTFGTVTFLGSRTATVNYDVLNGNVFLNNFQVGQERRGVAGELRSAGALRLD